MKRITAIGVILALALPAGIASATEFYVGGDYLHTEFKFDGESLSPAALSFVAGARLNPNFAIEGRAGFGIQDDGVSATFNGQTFSADLEIDNILGVYGRGILPVSEAFEVYAMLGFTRGKATVRVREPGMTMSASESENDFSFGVGGAFNLSPSMAINLEWARLLDKNDLKVDGISVGFRYRF